MTLLWKNCNTRLVEESVQSWLFFSAPNIIYIAKLDFNDLCNQSILLHEIIHVFQYQLGNEIQNVFREKEAYEIQNKFLINESLKNDFLKQLNLKNVDQCNQMF